MSLPLQILLCLGVFAVVTALALLLGAVNLGVAATFGMLAYGAAVVFVIARLSPGRG